MLQKYLKYKQKYINLKKLIGGGTDATCRINIGVKDSDNESIEDNLKQIKTITIKYSENDTEHELTYQNISDDIIGAGSFGAVYKIQIPGDPIHYIFKMKHHVNKKFGRKPVYHIVDEGKRSDLLDAKNILDEDSRVIFQGFIYNSGGGVIGEFLISKYNGIDLEKKYSSSESGIIFNQNEKIHHFQPILKKILSNIKELNNNGLYHNDIKLGNIVINDTDNVRLIDFGALHDTSKEGTFSSMSYKSILAIFKNQKIQNEQYTEFIEYLDLILKDTDIFGFFYCCIDLLFLLNDENRGSGTTNIFQELQILDPQQNIIFQQDQILNKLFNLYYLILPETHRKYTKIIDTINNNTNFYTDKETPPIFLGKLLPSVDDTSTFWNISDKDENINLYRYILFIYNFLIIKNIGSIVKEDNLKQFLLGIGKCLLPDFNYSNFDFDTLSELITPRGDLN